jgi:CubicO group peptidase (beta-lactamase class C family)
MRVSQVETLLLLVALSNVPWPCEGQQSRGRAALARQQVQPRAYFPARDDWQRRRPSQVGMDDSLLAQAVVWAQTQETSRPRDLSDQVPTFGRLLGPMPKERGGVNGIIIRHGYIVAEFGETMRVDPTYSVAKSYLSTILGLAIDRGMIHRITDPVRDYIHDGGYDSPQNAKVTWEDHARQTSEWEGTMFGKPDTFLGAEEFGAGARPPRERHEPGTFYEYNDVRINRLSLSLLRLWKRPLPDVLKTEIMDPIGASDSWHYYGYDNSDVDVDGKVMKSVSGGTRWGGGLWMSTRDHARFGLLILNKGNWNGRPLVSAGWVAQATARGGPADNDYGYLWWLNTRGHQWPDAPRSSFAAIGAGSNTVWIDPEHDLVVVWRWHRSSENEFYKRILASIVNPR